MKNIYYFRKIYAIGGIETFFRNMSEEYKDLDITFYYEYADPAQLLLISKYCRCIKFDKNDFADGHKVKCDKAFFNFNLDMLPYVDAKETVLVVHGNYKWLGVPPQHKLIDRVVAVSKDAAEAYTELTGIPCEVCYNPLLYKEPKRLVKLVCACRLADPNKGINRLAKFVECADKYCDATGNKYMLTIFSNGGTINSPNVAIMPNRVDIIPYMNDADYLLQFSNNLEGYCYSVNEMLYLCKKPVVITPCNVFEELGIDDTMAIRLNFDLSNIEDVVKKVFTKTDWNINYAPPKDTWDKLLAKGKSTYNPNSNVNVKAIRKYDDIELHKRIMANEVFEVTEQRAAQLVNADVARIIPT